MRTLVADDDADSRMLLMDLLPQWGHEPVGAVDGAEAWTVLSGKDAPQLAILDWVMPGMDGVQLCARLRETDRQSPLYIILLTSRHQPQDVVRALDAGADDYVTKPFDFAELRARLQVGCRILGLQAHLCECERLRTILQTAGAVCHEMNQPLQAVLDATELLSITLSHEDPNYDVLVALREGVERLGQITRRTMSLAHSRTTPHLSEADRIIGLNPTPGFFGGPACRTERCSDRLGDDPGGCR